MTKARRKLTKTEELQLCTQVGGFCPLSGKSLFAVKNGRSSKRYQIAHIYPLNPTNEEITLLKNEDILNADPNHLDNLIPLEVGTHNAFDNPRTVEEYRNLCIIKKTAIADEADKSMMSSSELETDIVSVINALHNEGSEEELKLNYEPKKIENKADSTLSNLTKRRIRLDVTDYYIFVQKRFKDLEYSHPNASELIAIQIKAYYLKQTLLYTSQETIFRNIVTWITSKTNPSSRNSAEIIASYFVQRCEIFK